MLYPFSSVVVFVYISLLKVVGAPQRIVTNTDSEPWLLQSGIPKCPVANLRTKEMLEGMSSVKRHLFFEFVLRLRASSCMACLLSVLGKQQSDSASLALGENSRARQ